MLTHLKDWQHPATKRVEHNEIRHSISHSVINAHMQIGLISLSWTYFAHTTPYRQGRARTEAAQAEKLPEGELVP